MDLFEGYEKAYGAAAVLPQQCDHTETIFFANLITERGLKVVDVGCAEGKLAVELARRGHDVTAADISADFLEQAQALARDRSLRIKTAQVDIERSIEPLDAERYDIVYLNDVIEHFRSPVAALHNLRRLLHARSRLFIHTPNGASMARFTWYLRHPHSRRNFFDPKVLADFHFSIYDQMALEKTLNFVGLRVERMVPTQFSSLGIHRVMKVFKGLPRTMAKLFPHLADTLLFECSKCKPIEPMQQIEHWKQNGVSG